MNSAVLRRVSTAQAARETTWREIDRIRRMLGTPVRPEQAQQARRDLAAAEADVHRLDRRIFWLLTHADEQYVLVDDPATF